MPNPIDKLAVRLEPSPDGQVHSNLSGAAFTGDFLWVAGDEACGLDRLRRLEPVGDEALRFGDTVTFRLSELFELPGAADGEADLEGMAFADGYLWVVGSHGLKRKKVDPARSHAINAKSLCKLPLDANRLVFARLPLEHDKQGHPVLRKKTADGRRAQCLRGNSKTNELTRLLADDPHYGRFCAIPGKDNGLDIEGLAVFGDRQLLGLRGPVLGGWAGLLEVAVKPLGNALRLARLGKSDLKLRKHFIHLGGLGLRDLHFDGDDLILLAGPTMALDGSIRLYRWCGARQQLAANRAPVAFWPEPQTLCELPHGKALDRAEAFCALPAELAGAGPRWLVLYDAPGPKRNPDPTTVFGDLVRCS